MDLNNELLQSPQKTVQSPKRNSKLHLIKRITELCEKTGIELEESDSKLKRMNKEQLQKKLAQVMEKEIKMKMTEQITGQKIPEASNTVLSIGALRMCHNIICQGSETLYNKIGAPYVGYELDGFAQNIRKPQYQETIDEILLEISQENPEILKYFESPYARLAMLWFSCCAMSMKKISVKRNVRNLGQHQIERTLRSEPSRRPEARQVRFHDTTSASNLRTI